MKKIAVLQENEVIVKTFDIKDFIQNKVKSNTMKKVTKKELRIVADRLNLRYSDKEIIFAKKLIQQLCK